jgi:hypothetical protein
MDIFWNYLTFKNGHFVESILNIHIWQSCLKLIKVASWTIQRQILLISNPFSSVFSPWICWWPWKVHEVDSPWHVRTLAYCHWAKTCSMCVLSVFSFCNLTTVFAVRVSGMQRDHEELIPFLVLGTSIFGLFSVIFIVFVTSNTF